MILKICLIVLILLLPQIIKVALILHLKHLGYKYIGRDQYEKMQINRTGGMNG
ncbi:hypothetical protein L1G36_002307 [Staphylococcus pseudintermedius]|uniref:hypothetical protein n=1 Tax=Staphylococcus pseudintermedius TaxID=283734 RepID=UPI0015CB06F5|nr:hypothetical protein [Staphylococcus pseudintermedius]EIT1231274.1 hypothetical protein [Staphylococcus pseudintermedius]